MNSTRALLGKPENWKDAQVHLSALQALWGGWQVFVGGDGVAVVRRITPVRREQRYKITLTGKEVQSLFETCIENDLLDVSLPKRPGHPDEMMIEIMLINAKRKTQTVKKWSGDTLAAFDNTSRLLFGLTTQTQDMLPFYSGPFEWPASEAVTDNPMEGDAI